MSKISKIIDINLTTEEVESPDQIQIEINVFIDNDKENSVTYTITYPKTPKLEKQEA